MVLPYPKEELSRVQIGEISLTFLNKDTGGTHYYGRVHFEEYLSPIYPLLKIFLSPDMCIDIGANYGYTALLMRKAFPKAHITLIEPIPWLENFINHNFRVNGVAYNDFHSSIVSVYSDRRKTTFHVDECASQDSRVIAKPGISQVTVDTTIVTLDELTAGVNANQTIYIKIDTQGWEQQVFLSGEVFLTRHGGWFIKTEFAPMWLESQGSSPELLLSYLLRRYTVYEYPGRLPWNCSNLGAALGQHLATGCEREFVNYVRNLGRNDTGWVDLFVIPPINRRTFSLEN